MDQKPVVAEAQDPVAILAAIDAVVYDWSLADDRLHWGPNVGKTLRELPARALETGADYADLLTADSESSRYQSICESAVPDDGAGSPFRVGYRLAYEGATLEVEDIGRWFADADGRPARAHGIVRVVGRGANVAPISAQEGGGEQVLSSRRAFNAWVDLRCAEPRAPDTSLALMVVGVGNAAEVNTRSGYEVGDELIAAVGRRLASGLRGGDKVVRFCGGKFALLVALSAADLPAVAAARIARRASAEFYRTSVGPIRAALRVGVALCPRHGRTSHLLMQRADEALAEALASGEPMAVYQASESRTEARERDSWVADEIIAALNERRIFLAYQPVTPTDRRGQPFEEALVRLRLEDGAVVGPEAIIPVAEKLGLVELIDGRVLEMAVARLAIEPDCRLSTNVSLTTLKAPGWFERLRDRLNTAPGVASRLTIEILETQAVDNVGEIVGVLAKVKALGVRVAMDDFGAGHTSFRNLRALGVDMVKIDGAFVQTLASSVDDRFFVRTLASLAKHLGIVTVAEWVEDAESARLLREWGVDYLQGHFIGRAAPQQPLPQAAGSIA